MSGDVEIFFGNVKVASRHLHCSTLLLVAGTQDLYVGRNKGNVEQQCKVLERPRPETLQNFMEIRKQEE